MLRSKLMFFAVVFVLSVFSLGSLAAQEKYIADKVVAVVGNSVVLYSEVDEMSKSILEQRKEQGYTLDKDPKCEALEQLVMQKILYNQSQIDSIEIPTDRIAEVVQNSIEQEIARRGSVAAMELYYHKPIFNIREDLKNRYEEMQYANGMESEIKDKVKVTPGEVEKYYKSMPKDSLPIVPEQYVYAQIIKYPSSIEDAKFRARSRLLEMRERIMNGTRFDVLARMYSEDGSAMQGGEMVIHNLAEVVQPFGEALSKLKENQVSEVVETEYGFHLIQLLEHKGDMYRYRHILLRPQYTDADLEGSFDLLDSLRNLVNEGKNTFEKLAAENSDDKYSKQNGGVVTNMDLLNAYQEANNPIEVKYASTRFMKENLNAQDYRELRNMKIGDVSAPFPSQDMKGNMLSKIIMLKEIIPSHPANLKEDYLNLENAALERKKNMEFDKWIEKKIDGMYIRIDDDFKQCDFKYKIVK